MDEIQRIMNEKNENNINKFSLDLHFINPKIKQPSISGYYYIYTKYGAIQSVYYSKKHNLWNAMDDYTKAAFKDDMVLYWIDDIKKEDNENNKDNNKGNKIEMTSGEFASKLLLAYYAGKLNEEENSLNEIATMNNTDVVKNIADKGQLIDWD